MEKFYMIMRDDCNHFSNKRHPTEEEAKQEAERLCKKEGKRFLVLTIIAYVEPDKTPVTWKTPKEHRPF